MLEKIDPRGYVVYPIAAPKGDDVTHHYLKTLVDKLSKELKVDPFAKTSGKKDKKSKSKEKA